MQFSQSCSFGVVLLPGLNLRLWWENQTGLIIFHLQVVTRYMYEEELHIMCVPSSLIEIPLNV